MNAITVAMEQAPPPPLVVMSLSLKITVNPRTGTNEVLRWAWHIQLGDESGLGMLTGSLWSGITCLAARIPTFWVVELAGSWELNVISWGCGL